MGEAMRSRVVLVLMGVLAVLATAVVPQSSQAGVRAAHASHGPRMSRAAIEAWLSRAEPSDPATYARAKVLANARAREGARPSRAPASPAPVQVLGANGKNMLGGPQLTPGHPQ